MEKRKPHPIESHTVDGERSSPAIVLGLLALGGLLWLGIGMGRGIGAERWILIGAGAVCAGMLAIKKPSATQTTFWKRIANPSPRVLDWQTVIIAIIATAYLILTAFNQGRDLFPKSHDECSYAIGMQIMARGRLAMPAIPIPDFFESFYILVTPAYCSKYFPGTALFFVPTVWLHWPTWLMPAMASGACVALVYRIVAELLDVICALLSALMMLSLSWFRMLSMLLMSNVPMLLFALLLYLFWLRWRKSCHLGWALAMGVCAGWGAIIRPIDAIVVALPVAVAVLWEMIRGDGLTWKKILATVAIAMIGAAPFLAMQIRFDVDVTANALQTPYGYYIDRFQPNTDYGFHAIDPHARAQTTLLQKQEYYDKWVTPFILNHRPANLARAWGRVYLPMMVDTAMQCRLLLLLIPVGLLGLRGIRRWIFWAVLPLFIILYLPSTFFLEHYAVLVAPAVILTVLMGGRRLASAFRGCERQVFAAFVGAVLMISVTSFWEINHLVAPPDKMISDETFPSPILRYVNEYLPYREDLQKPAVILFTYHSGGKFSEEPVYNTDVAWPDDAPIIRAHDLGAQNQEIFNYYARVKPDVTFYQFDSMKVEKKQDPLVKLGSASSLSQRSGR
ncbi:MAG TPA: glycosyltransferase family 39 protein [Tepidisphaeraceae bacterium]|nr:glycosyltransferase family 39 protein [Tepidisphaeraceae bacterium]